MPIQAWLHPPGHAKLLVESEIDDIISGRVKHNMTSCSVCARKRRMKTGTKASTRRPFREIPLNDLTGPLYEEGESIRPSVPPKQALSTVLSQLKDEFHHLQLYVIQRGLSDGRRYRELTTEYESLDPGRGKRKRKSIAEKLRAVIEEFEAKADQIYALYDVVEGVRQEGLDARRQWLEL
jgi:Centrosome microtubule-binding domain of Cep57